MSYKFYGAVITAALALFSIVLTVLIAEDRLEVVTSMLWGVMLTMSLYEAAKHWRTRYGTVSRTSGTEVDPGRVD